MKARVKATGKIVEVREEYDLRDAFVQVFYSNEEDPYEVYKEEELDFNVNDNIDPTIGYWTRLEHQYAGMAMQQLVHLVNVGYEYVYEETALIAMNFAHALVEKLKEKEERK